MTVLRTVTMGARTDRGLVRAANEDVALMGSWASGADAARSAPAPHDLLSPWSCAVIDGMGGHSHGELAAWITTHVLMQRLDACVDGVTADNMVHDAHLLVSDACTGAGAPDAGAAFAALVLRPTGYAVLNVGDCRVYRVVAGRLDLLSVDDAVPSRADPDWFVLTQAVGGGTHRSIDAHWYAMDWDSDAAERFVLASDGLAAAGVSDPPRAVHPGDAASELVDRALQGGAPDNVTVVVVDVRVPPRPAV